MGDVRSSHTCMTTVHLIDLHIIRGLDLRMEVRCAVAAPSGCRAVVFFLIIFSSSLLLTTIYIQCNSVAPLLHQRSTTYNGTTTKLRIGRVATVPFWHTPVLDSLFGEGEHSDWSRLPTGPEKGWFLRREIPKCGKIDEGG